MSIQDNYYEIALIHDSFIFAPKSGTQITDNFVAIKKGIVISTLGTGIDQPPIKTTIGAPPLLTLTIPFNQIAFIKELIGNYEEAAH